MPQPQEDQGRAEQRWSIAVFARNEAESLVPCLRAIEKATVGTHTRVAFLLNGTTDNSVAVLRRELPQSDLLADVYDIPFADKSNAWNQFIYCLRPQAGVYFFADAYAAVEEAALTELATSLALDEQAHVAAAVPSCGRSAGSTRSAMLADGGIHGSLFAVRGTFLDRLTAQGLRLPIGLYRGDGLIGSFVAHDLDPQTPWVSKRVRVTAGATWRTRPLSPWRLDDLRRQARRLVQQCRGRYESEAIKAIIYKSGFQALPAFADHMLLDWLQNQAGSNLNRHGLLGVFVRRALHRPRAPLQPDITATLLLTSGRQTEMGGDEIGFGS